MSETRWTPGPWAVTVESGTVYVTRRWSGDYTPEASDLFGSHLGGRVAAAEFHTFDGGICSKQRAVANAHLIAAAPELYEALKDVLRSARKDFPSGEWGEAQFEAAYGEALDALRKARGEVI